MQYSSSKLNQILICLRETLTLAQYMWGPYLILYRLQFGDYPSTKTPRKERLQIIT